MARRKCAERARPRCARARVRGCTGADARAACAKRHGLDISDLRARQLRRDDFSSFSLIVAMDRENLHDIERARPSRGGGAEVRLFTSFVDDAPYEDVPDCYYADGDCAALAAWRACCGLTLAVRRH